MAIRLCAANLHNLTLSEAFENDAGPAGRCKPMAALSHFRPNTVVRAMSAITPIATRKRTWRHVCSVPFASFLACSRHVGSSSNNGHRRVPRRSRPADLHCPPMPDTLHIVPALCSTSATPRRSDVATCVAPPFRRVSTCERFAKPLGLSLFLGAEPAVWTSCAPVASASFQVIDATMLC